MKINNVVWEGRYQAHEFRITADGSLYEKDEQGQWRLADKGEFNVGFKIELEEKQRRETCFFGGAIEYDDEDQPYKSCRKCGFKSYLPGEAIKYCDEQKDNQCPK